MKPILIIVAILAASIAAYFIIQSAKNLRLRQQRNKKIRLCCKNPEGWECGALGSPHNIFYIERDEEPNCPHCGQKGEAVLESVEGDPPQPLGIWKIVAALLVVAIALFFFLPWGGDRPDPRELVEKYFKPIDSQIPH
jgi:hypothetical protein